MAQAVFDEHPLERYLRDVGEAPELMPGGSSDFIGHDDDDEDALYVESEEDVSDPKNELLTNWCTRVQSIVSQFTSTSRPFVERFKYDIISSSLLSTSLSNSRPVRLMSESIPGGTLHSRTSSVDHSSPPSSAPTSSPPEYWLPSVALAMVVVFSSAEYYFLALLSVGVMFLTVYVEKFDAKGDVSPVMDTLKDLISANDAWNSVVHEVLTLVEKDEKYSSVPSSPSSPLRVALSSTLHTTQMQSDNVRNLFAALTSPSELSQLSEMYAPPSPPPKSFPPRPISEPGSRRLSFTSRDSKRSTWNGSYSSLAVAGSPTRQILKRREKRRSDLSALLGIPTSQSEPVTPVSALSGVQEQEEDHDTSDDDELSFTNQPEGSTPFGMAALDLRRRRKSAGLDALGMSFNRSYVYPPRSPISTSSALRSPTASASKFTAVQPARHPLSLSSLQTLLQGTLGSKRYACAHLLALRFGEDDDEGYWEDVRSVMELLTSTFADTAARLTEALEEAERLKLRLENPSPNSLPSHSRSVSLTGQSFAPMPSHMSRFAVHVDAISSALKDAREDLDQCVDALREESLFPPSPHPALEAYERLRRELGLALRECERGRERLLDIISPPRLDDDPDPDVDPFGGDSVGISDDLPGLASDDSDKPDSSAAPAEYGDVTVDQNAIIMEERLPPPGIEQVFESEEGAGMVFHREKSKLSREERIKLVKQRRERGETALVPREQPDDGGLKVEKWGPGGEVVQELKDVIWKVGEKRRRLFNVPSTAPPPLLDSVNVI
ncbi:uncharacterized protein EV420DRAFT_1325585 [Desarmillaria tabescens]|uniref:Uncharacterized protein n=1 Tax=Armillaria tabescens TaxID=1929756 RepID=A0AA39TYH1_ARMTA|nr:uncharacterized protein EV420DRAFT_1325585 [Desarmillaria tabescens]KAK0466754.1 hypothetical protein EV420DRAFT_1325585 [Desarmillaria tabescens]